MAATGDIFGIGTSALTSYQRVLATTGHNIANVQNEHYSRQRAELDSNIPQRTGAGFIGSGVHVSTIERFYDGFLTATVRDHQAAASELETFDRYVSQMDNLLADPETGLMPAVEEFFNAVHDVASDPTSIPARGVMLSTGESLADRLHYMNSRIDELAEHVHGEMRQTVGEINAYAQDIARLNQDILLQTGASGGQPPNDLLDQRDAAIAELSERVGVKTVQQSDGQVNVFIGNGQTLVAGSNAFALGTAANEYDPRVLEVTYQNTTGSLSDFISGGRLGGLLDIRDNVMETTRNELGRIAVSIAEVFNQQHQQGMDLSGGMGQEFFFQMDQPNASVIGPQALASAYNDAATDVTGAVTFSNSANLQGSDYQLDYDGANYTLTRLSDNSVVGTVAAGALPQTLSFAGEGFDVTLSGTTIAAGDRFMVRPTYNGAYDIGVAITDPAEIAAAAPFRIDEATGANGVPTNQGSAQVSPGVMSNAVGATLTDIAANPLTLTFDPNAGGAGVPGFDITPAGPIAGANPILYDPAANNGDSYTVDITGFGSVTFSISGTPEYGDAFVIRDNALDNSGVAWPGGVGDARNAGLLADLQTSDTMAVSGGSSSFQGAYGHLVADVGIKAQQTEVNLQARDKLLAKAQDDRDALSGVNLDEEAANLIKFQQAYQAAAQVMSVGRDVFQTLLSSVGR